MKEYKFRAECNVDVERLKAVFDDAEIVYEMEVKQINDLPDVEIDLLTTNISLEDMHWYMGRVVDGHVMTETLALKENYTGERT